jgi:hypothetical protein
MWHVWDSGVVFTGLLLGNQRERDHLEELCIDVRIINNGSL